jgi:isopentenyldiphosphate isomerase
MKHKYYKEKQMIAMANKKGEITGKVEKWEAHKKGILHKGFTLILKFKDYYVLQPRKPPAFDGMFDLTFSSHQVFENGKLQDINRAIYEALDREWKIDKKDFSSKPKKLGVVYYREKDTKSIYTEHEMDEILSIEIKSLPVPNHEFAYGYSLVGKKELLDKKGRIYPLLAPWARKIIEKKMI